MTKLSIQVLYMEFTKGPSDGIKSCLKVVTYYCNQGRRGSIEHFFQHVTVTIEDCLDHRKRVALTISEKDFSLKKHSPSTLLDASDNARKNIAK